MKHWHIKTKNGYFDMDEFLLTMIVNIVAFYLIVKYVK